jgi:hypothetical protein
MAGAAATALIDDTWQIQTYQPPPGFVRHHSSHYVFLFVNKAVENNAEMQSYTNKNPE